METEAKLTVYGWSGWRRECECQTREIVAAPSAEEAAALAGEKNPRSLGMFESDDEEEIRLALSAPGAIFWRSRHEEETTWQRSS